MQKTLFKLTETNNKLLRLEEYRSIQMHKPKFIIINNKYFIHAPIFGIHTDIFQNN